ncbi:MAG: DUF521 domain-containing protein [Oscillospiraceae bacterium]|nr:DUF521 domain-containing protein [Oscillospiraceae bacterium]
MILTPEQQAILDGEKGEVLSKVMKTLVMYGEAFGAEKLVPVTSKYGHTVISFGINAMKPVYDLYDQILSANVEFKQKFTADPLPLDPNVPSSLLQDLVFKQFMYKQQERYEDQLRRMGITGSKDFTCACYFDEVGNIPEKGDVLSWAESSAVSYANSVLGARCNRNSGMIDIMGSAVGYVPYFGLLTDEGRKAPWVVEVKTSARPEAQLLGSAIGMKVMEDVPYIRGLDKYFPDGLDADAKAYLKDFGAAAASNGAVGLYHVEGLTPEAVEQGESLILDGAQVYVVDDAELERVRASYPVIWKNPDAKPKLCFVGCPHLTMDQLIDWTEKVEAGLRKNCLSKVTVPTVFTTAPAVVEEFNKGPYGWRLKKTGVVLSYICPLMYMNNPLSKKMPVITCSNKLRTYTSARYYTESEILDILTGKEAE